MDKTLFVCSTHRVISHQTDILIQTLDNYMRNRQIKLKDYLRSLGHGAVNVPDITIPFNQGLSHIYQRGTTDVSLARNIALSMTCEILDKHSFLETALMFDDDMGWEPNEHSNSKFVYEDAQLLINMSREKKRPVSCVYSNTADEICATPYKDGWKTGLGFIAIPRDLLLKLREDSYAFDVRGQRVYEFTWSGVDKETGDWQAEAHRLVERLGKKADVYTEWNSSDHRLVRRLGGAIMHQQVVLGHVKERLLYPSKEAVARVLAEGEEIIRKLNEATGND